MRYRRMPAPSHGCVGGAFQPVAPCAGSKRHLRAVRRIGLEQRFHRRASQRGRRPAAAGAATARVTSTAAARCPRWRSAGKPSAPMIDSAGRHVRFSSASAASSIIGRVPSANGYLRNTMSPRIGSSLRCLRDALRRNLRVKGRRHDPARCRILEAVEELARDAKRRRHDAARIAGVHAFGQHLDRQLAGREPAQRRRHPQALVIAAAGVEADDEVDVAETRLQRVEVGGQVVAAALLAASR